MAWAISIALLGLHLYFYCYQAFILWNLHGRIADHILANAVRSGLFHHRPTSKIFALASMAFAMIGARPSPRVKGKKTIIVHLVVGLVLYFGSDLVLWSDGELTVIASLYIGVTLAGFIWLSAVANLIAGQLQWRTHREIFNRYNESFPQEERLLSNQYSVNLRAKYTFRNQTRISYVNPAVFRGVLVAGQSGSGKSFYIFRQFLEQQLQKNYCAFVYDFKFDDLTRLTWNLLKAADKTATVKRAFYLINFDDLSRTNRCNPLDPASMQDLSDATESSRTILLALNREWIHKQGDFFIESAIAFVAANIWFLRKYEDGKYCTLPHLIELIQSDYNKLFSVLRSIREIETLINPFVSAFLSNSMDQLEGQVASARISMSALSSPQLYYVLSGNEFTLDINNPQAPKVVCMGSSPAKQQVYGAVLSLYVTRMHKLINRKGGLPCALYYDEAPTLYMPGLDMLLATGRAHKISVVLGIQSIDQLRKEYGRAQGDALFNLPGNLFCGQATGDTAQMVSDRFGKILQEKTTVNVNSRDSSTSQSQHLDQAVPPSKISNLSSGEFVGIVADEPMQKIDLKGFHNQILVDFDAIRRQQSTFGDLPENRTVTPELLQFEFNQKKDDIQRILDARLTYMHNNPNLARLIVTKKEGQHQNRQSK